MNANTYESDYGPAMLVEELLNDDLLPPLHLTITII